MKTGREKRNIKFGNTNIDGRMKERMKKKMKE